MSDLNFLSKAIELSRHSVDSGGFPVGAVISREGKIISEGISNGKQETDPTSHAETAAIRIACSLLGTRSLKDCVLYSSMEPCVMCLMASSWASIPRIVYAAPKNRLSPQHSEGSHNSAKLVEDMRKPVVLQQIAELEEQALRVITDWESYTFSRQDKTKS